MKRLIVIAAILGTIVLTTSCQRQTTQTPEQATLTTVGQQAPTFVATTTTGETFDLADQRGKVVLLNFFATWCPPCRQELPHLEQEVWARFKEQPFTVLCIGREHDSAELESFATELGLSMPMAGDPDRAAFSLYATQYIPRNVVIGQDGTIIYQGSGYSEEEFSTMIGVIEQALASQESSGA